MLNGNKYHIQKQLSVNNPRLKSRDCKHKSYLEVKTSIYSNKKESAFNVGSFYFYKHSNYGTTLPFTALLLYYLFAYQETTVFAR